MVILTDKNFEERLLVEPALVVNFTAAWCGSCQAMAPVVDQIDAENLLPVQIVKLDVDESPFAAAKYGIRSIPTLLFIKNGVLADKAVGPLPKSAIVKKLRDLFGSKY